MAGASHLPPHLLPRWPHGRMPAPPRPGHDIHWPIWWVTFVSLTAYNLAIGVSTALMAGFLLTWVMYFLAWPARGLDRIARTLLPLAFPLLALTSSLWSQAAAITFRNGIQLLLTTSVGILIARAQSARSFTAALMCVMLFSVVVGTAFGGTAAIGIRGDSALVGIFGSKNNFALMISFTMLAAVAVLLDPQQPRILRLFGLLGCLISPPLLILAKSVGAIITLAIALGVLGVFILASRMPARGRPAVYIGAAILALAGLGVLLILQSTGVLEELLRSAGKDTSLTGRTFLWARAETLIPLNPILGVGYQAFWVQETPEAEGLWRFSTVAARSGFHFHNLYYETVIELGFAGVLVLGATLVALAIAVLAAAFRRPCPEHAFFVSLVVIFGSRAYVELDFLSPFTLGSLLIPILWSYCSRPAEQASRRLRRPPPVAAAAAAVRG